MLSTMLRVIIFDNTRDKYLKRIKKNISDKKYPSLTPYASQKKKKPLITVDDTLYRLNIF